MTISRVGVGTVSAVTTAALPGYPTVASGDRLIMVTFSDSTAQPTDPATWGTGTPVASGGGMNCTVWTKIAAGTETGTVTVNGFTSGTKGASWIENYRGSVVTPTPTIQTAADTDTSSTTAAATGTSWTAATDDWIVGAWALLAPSASYTANATGPTLSNAGTSGTNTSRFNSRTGTNTVAYGGLDLAITSGGTGAPSFSATTVGANAAGMVAFVLLTEDVSATQTLAPSVVRTPVRWTH